MRILFILGTRPEAIKLFPLIKAAKARQGWKIEVCSTGQHRQMLDQVFNLVGIHPTYDLNVMKPSQSLSQVTSAVLNGMDSVLQEAKPDIVIVQGDTTSAMAGAIAAFYRQIPVSHVEAGLRSWDLSAPFPEEMNRKIISSFAALHFAPTKLAADNLLSEHVDRGSVHVTGNTVVDALHWIRARLDRVAAIQHRFAPEVRLIPTDKRLILVTTHRRENFDGGIARIAQSLAKLARRGDVTIAFPVHLNPNVRKPVGEILAGTAGVHLLEPLEYLPFVHLMSRAHLIITDSGGVQEEAPAFGVPVLVTREKTERPEGVEAGTALLVGSDGKAILREATRLLDNDRAYRAMSRSHNPFGDGKASARIIRILERWASGTARRRRPSKRR